MSSSFAPSGITDDTEIRTASSITDYIFRRLALDYLSFDDRLELGLASLDDLEDSLADDQTSLLTDDQSVTGQMVHQNGKETAAEPAAPAAPATASQQPKVTADAAPLCFNCGNQTQRAGSCYVCTSCGSTTGCS
jgi:ribonucleoside-diphosphate reductase alpha chain